MTDELGRWLSRVRPPTTADDRWAASENGAEVLAAVHRRVTSDASAWVKLRRVVPLEAIAVTAAAAVIALLVTDVKPAARPPAPPAPVAGARPSMKALAAFDTCDGLLTSLRTHLAAAIGPYGLPGLFGAPDSRGQEYGVPSPVSLPARASTPGYSTTNVQEAGVDEPDVVKSDGSRIVSLSGGVLRVVDAASHEVTGALDLTMYAGWQGATMLVSGNSALVISGSYPYGTVVPRIATPRPAGPYGPGEPSTYLFVNLAGTPGVIGSLRTSGSYLAARLIGSTVRLVAASRPDLALPSSGTTDAERLASNRAAVQRASLDAWLPTYTLTSGGVTARHQVPCQQISHPAGYTGASMITVYTFDISHSRPAADPVTVVGDGDTVYVTDSSLYVASNPAGACCPAPPSAEVTQLHRFDLTRSGAPTYLGSGQVPGRLIDQYALSDYAGHLRVATTSGRGPDESNGVYVLDAATLRITGRVDGLDRGESIFAVRYIGPMAYVVTFRQVDPLIVLDLHDPTAPRRTGELVMSGYSDYLHDAGQGRLIGVGQQVNAAGIVGGIQVSLFDVRDPAAPRRVAQVVRSDAVSEMRLDPHAFLYWPPTGLIVVPMPTWQGTATRALVVRLQGESLSTIGVISNPAGVSAQTADGGIQRALIADGSLWTLSDSGLQYRNPTTLTVQGWVAFG
jgi:hypothetical protein